MAADIQYVAPVLNEAVTGQLISAFVFCYIHSTIPLLSKFHVSGHFLGSPECRSYEAAQVLDIWSVLNLSVKCML